MYKTMGSKEIERAMMGKGAVLGETALIFGKPRSASAVVVEECTTLQIESEVIQRKIQGVPSWWMKKLSLYNKFKDMDPSV